MKTGTHFGRRTFLGHMAAGAMAASLPAWALPSFLNSGRSSSGIMLNQVTLSDFSPHLHTAFCLHTDTGTQIELRLAEATSLRSSVASRPDGLNSRDPFSLVFTAPPGANLSQRIYRLHHPALGTFEIFLVPIGRHANALTLEAIFN